MKKIAPYLLITLVLTFVSSTMQAHALSSYLAGMNDYLSILAETMKENRTRKLIQDVCSQSQITLSSQAEVDAFNCSEMTGHLEISGDDITNLEALSSLKRVGSISISGNPNLPNLHGLESLEEVTGSFQPVNGVLISGNAALENIDALHSLAEISGNFFVPIEIVGNPMLKNIDGLVAITTLAGSLNISNNASLENLDGLRNLTGLQGPTGSTLFTALLSIEGNSALKNVDGLSSLKIIDGGRNAGLFIINNSSLTNIDGLSSFTTLDATLSVGLEIVDNTNLENINGLMSLSRLGWGISGHLSIQKNSSLENVDGLSSVRNLSSGVDFFSVTVLDNPMLKRCCGLYPLFSALGPEADITVSGNAVGCTKEDILAGGPCGEAIGNFSVVNVTTGEIVKYFSEAVTLDMADHDFSKWTIQANTIPASVGSVIFELNGKKSYRENRVPYRLPRHAFASLTPGTHTLTGEVFSRAGGKGVRGIGISANIEVINGASIENLQVVSTTGEVLFTLKGDDALNIEDPALQQINIVANTNAKDVERVAFYLNDRLYRIENKPPYYLKGDSKGRINEWRAEPGAYTIKAVPFVRQSGKHHEGTPLVLTFNVIAEPVDAIIATAGGQASEARENASMSISIFPVPVHEALYVNVENPPKGIQLTIINSHGRKVHTEYVASLNSKHVDLSQAASTLVPGLYYLQVRTKQQVVAMFRFLKE